MPNYHRLFIPGATYFFTHVTYQRRPILTSPEARQALRQAIQTVRATKPFDTLAFVLLPDHFHTIWRLPAGDNDYPKRWMAIKMIVSKKLAKIGIQPVWQPRYWEHAIRDERDLLKHIDYIHWNPMKHGLESRVQDWPWSTYHRYVSEGIYGEHWCGGENISSTK